MFRHTFKVVMISLLLSAAPVQGAKPKTPKPPKVAKAKAKPAAPAPPAEIAAVKNKEVTASDAKALLDKPLSPDEAALSLGGDYIPCKFSKVQLTALHDPDAARVLSAADAEAFKTQVMRAALQSAQGDDVSEALKEFIAKLSKEDFNGLTPTAALNKVIACLKPFKKPPDGPADPVAVRELSNELRRTAPKALQPVIDPIVTEFEKRVKRDGTPEAELRYKARNEMSNIVSQSEIPPRLMALTNTSTAKTYTQGEIETIAADFGAKVLANKPPDIAQGVVAATRQALSIFSRPIDVGCAMSILDFPETSHAYGRNIANEYIAVQIVVRNLNKDQGFLVHDVEFAVNADPHGRLGRFYSGRDKIIVRALSATQQNTDPRNIAVHTAAGIGSLLTAIAPLYLGAVTDAAGVLTTFNTAFDKYWKDLSFDQLNLLNDTGFSSASNSQTFVPKTGSSMFVAFIPSRQFSEGWWTQRCVDQIYVGSTNGKGQLMPLALPQSQSTVAGNGIDVDLALQGCTFDDPGVAKPGPLSPAQLSRPFKSRQPEKVRALYARDPSEQRNADLFRMAHAMPYRKWSGNALAIFRELSTAIVAGTHIIEQADLQISLSQLTCPSTPVGDVDLASVKDKLTCTLAGRNLEKIAKVRLFNAEDSADPATADGTVAVVGGEATSASVSFVSEDLRKLKARSYNVFTVDAKGIDVKTAQVLHFDLTPVAVKYSPAEIDLTTGDDAAHTVTVKGYHLEPVRKLNLTHASDSVEVNIEPLSLGNENEIKFVLKAADLKKFGTAATKLTMELITGKNVHVALPGDPLSFTGAK